MHKVVKCQFLDRSRAESYCTSRWRCLQCVSFFLQIHMHQALSLSSLGLKHDDADGFLKDKGKTLTQSLGILVLGKMKLQCVIVFDSLIKSVHGTHLKMLTFCYRCQKCLFVLLGRYPITREWLTVSRWYFGSWQR